MGLVPTQGRVHFRGSEVPRHNPAAAAAMGLVLVPEGRGIFGPMTVADNLELGAYLLKGDKAELARRHERVLSLFPRLKERRAQVAGSLSGGEQQMLAVGRALMAATENAAARRAVARAGSARRRRDPGEARRNSTAGPGIMLVEQKAPLALKLASRVYVMSLGQHRGRDHPYRSGPTMTSPAIYLH